MSDTVSCDCAHRFAVVDIGSNTAKLTVYECLSGAALEPLFHDSDTVRISYRLSSTGTIAAERAERLLQCLSRFERESREHGAERFIAVATQAFRSASNSWSVVEQIESSTSWKLNILSAGDETRLTLEGARPWLVPNKWNVVADIGGASTEVISVSPDGHTWRCGSVEVGSGRLFDEEITVSPPPGGTIANATCRARTAMAGSYLLPQFAHTLLLPGGSGHFLHKLLGTIAPAHAFDRTAVRALHDWLASHPAETTVELIGVQIDRAQVLPASLAIVEALVSDLNPETILPVPSGIADGAAREHCKHAFATG